MKATNLKRVLVVDDEEGPRLATAMALEGLVTVETAKSGDEALYWMKSNTPDLVVSDICMIGMDGLELLKESRQRYPEVPFIILTGFGNLGSAKLAIRLGAKDYMTKPVDLKPFRERVLEVINENEEERERQQTIVDLNDLNRRITRKLASLEVEASTRAASSEFLHDIRNPLTNIMFYLDVLQENLAEVEEKTDIAITESMDALKNISDAVMHCSQLAQLWQNLSTPISRLMRPMPLREVMLQSQSIFAPIRNKGKIRLDLGEIPDVDIVISFPHFKRALHNLVSNAVHALHGQENPSVHFQWNRLPEAVELKVCDNGCGIPGEMLDSVLEPYVSTRRDTLGGTGLGLPISVKIIESFDGSLQVSSVEGEGTAVHISLPLASAQNEKIAQIG